MAQLNYNLCIGNSEQVRQARQADLVEWLRASGVRLKRIGQWWYAADSSSLRIQGNKWYHNSKGIGGNAIDYLVKYHGFTAQEAIAQLSRAKKNDGVKEENIISASATATKGFDFNAIDLHGDQRRVLAYLIKTRGISASVALSQIRNSNLFQESKTGNAVFPMKNEQGAIVGAEVAGTMNFENTRFKGLKSGSNTTCGFNVGERQNPKYVLYFESAIDLLSFITITQRKGKSMKSCLLISMAGLRHSLVSNTLQTFGHGIATPVFCTDNDVAGNEFIHLCCSRYPNSIVKLPDLNFKDWNEHLLKNLT